MQYSASGRDAVGLTDPFTGLEVLSQIFAATDIQNRENLLVDSFERLKMSPSQNC
jgi:hypothetical protein